MVLTFHYREVPVEAQPKLKYTAQRLIEATGFKVGQAHCAIEAKPPVSWNKGQASLYILRCNFGIEWSKHVKIIYAGDDVTDEDAMKALKGIAATFRVTQAQIVETSAEYCLPSTESVLDMLKWIENNFCKHLPPNGENESNCLHEVSLGEMNLR